VVGSGVGCVTADGPDVGSAEVDEEGAADGAELTQPAAKSVVKSKVSARVGVECRFIPPTRRAVVRRVTAAGGS
jgi:hypothetical protein